MGTAGIASLRKPLRCSMQVAHLSSTGKRIIPSQSFTFSAALVMAPQRCLRLCLATNCGVSGKARQVDCSHWASASQLGKVFRVWRLPRTAEATQRQARSLELAQLGTCKRVLVCPVGAGILVAQHGAARPAAAWHTRLCACAPRASAGPHFHWAAGACAAACLQAAGGRGGADAGGDSQAIACARRGAEGYCKARRKRPDA